jgi:TatD DNase family protein
MRLFDTHAHLDDEQFDTDRDTLIPELPDRGVSLCLTVGCDAASSARAIALAEQYPHLVASIGVHCHVAEVLTEEQLQQMEEWTAHRRVVAVGEIGLDYHYDFRPKDVQMQCFEQQLDVARRTARPVMYHIREAWGDFMPMLRNGLPFGVMHCFSGSVEVARDCLNRGLYISLAGPVTFKNARNLHEVAKFVPLDRLVVETDCPYLAPEPVRGRRNEPGNVGYTAAAVAALRGMEPEEFAEAAFQNGCRLFGINEFGERIQ